MNTVWDSSGIEFISTFLHKHIMARKANSLRSAGNGNPNAKRSWFRRHPLASGLLVVGVAAVSTYLFVSRPWSGRKPVGKEPAAEIRANESKKNERKKQLDTLRQILKIRKELKEKGMLEGKEGVLHVTVSDLEKKFRTFADGVGKDTLVDVLKEYEGQVAELENEYLDATEGMYIDEESGEVVGSRFEEEIEVGLRLKLMEAKTKQNLLLEKVDEIELAESGLLGMNREDLEILLLQTDGWETYLPVNYYPWEQEYPRHLILKAIYIAGWMDG